VHEAALFFLFIFACYGIVLWSISDLSLFQYNDAQFSCVFKKKNVGLYCIKKPYVIYKNHSDARAIVFRPGDQLVVPEDRLGV
jgi:hypothetical protein